MFILKGLQLNIIPGFNARCVVRKATQIKGDCFHLRGGGTPKSKNSSHWLPKSKLVSKQNSNWGRRSCQVRNVAWASFQLREEAGLD